MTDETTTRDCVICGQRKLMADFFLDSVSGIGRRCRKCRNEIRKTKHRAAPHKINANQKLNRAVKTRKIVREPCVVCAHTGIEIGSRRVRGGPRSVVAHHCDYSKPLEVMWLCDTHHRAWHRIFIAEGA